MVQLATATPGPGEAMSLPTPPCHHIYVAATVIVETNRQLPFDEDQGCTLAVSLAVTCSQQRDCSGEGRVEWSVGEEHLERVEESHPQFAQGRKIAAQARESVSASR